mgnify:CR=1 FL=1
MWIKLYIVFMSCFSASCTTLTSDEISDSISETYIGIVKVNAASSEQSARHVGITTLGVWSNNRTSGLGFLDSQIITVSPDCQITFIIENRQQLERSIALISSSLGDEKEGICVAGRN